MKANLVEIFYLVDEFCKEFDKVMEGHILAKDTSKKSRKRAFHLCASTSVGQRGDNHYDLFSFK